MGTLFDLKKLKDIQQQHGNLFNFNYPRPAIEHVCAVAI